ncbi:hypothetical protein SCHPADRAFT_847678, partial [Schizopora paradoxa]
MDVSVAARSPILLKTLLRRSSTPKGRETTSTTPSAATGTARGIVFGASAVDLRYNIPDVQLAITGGALTFSDDLALALQPPPPPCPRPLSKLASPLGVSASPMAMERPPLPHGYLPEQGGTSTAEGNVEYLSSNAAGPSTQPDQIKASRPKIKKFDIKISHFSDMAANDGDSGSPTRNNKDGAAGPVRTKKRSGRERTKIELAPDQPATTQGKPRERVYVACVQCRSRKIRCDGAKPMCYNCTQRSTGVCEYDAVPKRRGPDRFPGSRQRPAKTEKQKPDEGLQQQLSEGSTILFSNDPTRNSTGDGGQVASSATVKRSNTESSRRRRNTIPTENVIRNEVEDTWTSTTLPVPVNMSVPQMPPQASREAPTVVHNQQTTPGTSLPSARRSSVAHISSHVRQGSTSSADTGSPTLAVPKISTASFVNSSVTPTSSASEPYTPADFYVGERHHADLTPAIFNRVEQPDHLLGIAGVAPHAAFDHYEKLAVAQPTVLPGDVGSYSASSQWPSSSVRSGISTSASPESSSLGDYSSPDAHPVQSAPNQAYVVDAHNTFVGEDRYSQSFVDQELQHRQQQSQLYSSLVSHGTGVGVPSGNEWQKTAIYSNESAPIHSASHSQSEHIGEPLLYSYNPYQWVVPVGSSVGYGTGDAAFITPTEEDEGAAQERLEHHQPIGRQSYTNTQRQEGFGITHPPSLDFVRKTWWDALLDTFASAQFYPTRVALGDQNELGVTYFVNNEAPPVVSRQHSQQLVISNLQFLFRNSNFWFAFINVPLFFQKFCNAVTRNEMQPALIYAVLGMGYFIRSSAAELGADGMTRTIWLMDKAQAALEASVHASWIDGELAQAAWIIALYEVAAHPYRSTTRTEAAFERLDNIIRLMSLTFLDADDTTSPTYPDNDARQSPSTAQASHTRTYAYPRPLYDQQHQRSSPHSFGGYTPLDRPVRSQQQLHSHTVPGPASGALPTCVCMKLSLVANWPQANEHTPMWLCTPAWHPDWTEAEIRREECRRLCWNTLSLTAGYTSYRAALGVSQHELFVIQPANFRLQFPGENLVNLPNLHLDGIGGHSSVHPTKETVWALYARAMLLWHACLRVRESNVSDHERAQFVGAVWQESDAIEEALNQHSCPLERAFLYGGREYLFNARMYISYEFRRFVPSVHAGAIHLHRQKAEEWLRHQADVAKRILQGLHTITGIKNNLVARRPFFIFWFMGQMSRCLHLWSLDNSLTFAIELSKKFLPLIDYLTALWPCEDQRRHYYNIRTRLENACRAIGAELPPPAQLSLPPPSQPSA